LTNEKDAPMRPSEAAAKLVLEALLPGAKMVFRSEQSHGEWDFDLHYASGTVAPVEVTASVDQDQAHMSARIRDKRKGGSHLAVTKCKKSWMILPMKSADVNNIRTAADAYLSVLEQADIGSFRFLDAFDSRLFKEAGIEKSLPFPVPQCVEDICYDLQIQSGSTISTGEPPKIFIQDPVRGGAVGASVAVEACEREARKDDNRKKLGAAKSYERHLVVYVDAMNGLPWVALTDFEPPLALPKIPGEITHIWLIGHAGETSENKFVVWRASAKETWRSCRVVVP
jgi:hypothetical protein